MAWNKYKRILFDNPSYFPNEPCNYVGFANICLLRLNYVESCPSLLNGWPLRVQMFPDVWPMSRGRINISLDEKFQDPSILVSNAKPSWWISFCLKWLMWFGFPCHLLIGGLHRLWRTPGGVLLPNHLPGGGDSHLAAQRRWIFQNAPDIFFMGGAWKRLAHGHWMDCSHTFSRDFSVLLVRWTYGFIT